MVAKFFFVGLALTPSTFNFHLTLMCIDAMVTLLPDHEILEILLTG